ncbi:MAG: hypothetical protein ACE5HL_04860 [Terriglobia bacterium]
MKAIIESNRSDLTIRLLVVAVLALFVFGLAKQSARSASKPKPLWRADLRPVDYREPKVWAEKVANSGWNLLALTDKNVLVAGFVTLDTPARVPPKPEVWVPWPGQLHVAFFEARTGKPLMTRKWYIPFPAAALWAGSDGKLLIRTGHLIRLYSANFEELKQRRIGRKSDEGHRTPQVLISPSGRSILTHRLANGEMEVIETDTLEVRQSWNQEDPFVTSLTDSHLAGSSRQNPTQILIRKLGEGWRPVAAPAHEGCNYPILFDNRTLILTGAFCTCKRVVVVSSDAQVLLTDRLGWRERVSKSVYPSRDGRRFAVLVEKMRGITIELLDMYSYPVPHRLVVYDIPSRRAIYSLKTKLLSKPGLHIALSPDGSLLAILANGVVEVYQLPQSETEPQEN